MDIELVVFDLAGTTVKDDQDVHHAFQRAFAQFGIDISLEDANEVMGMPKPVAIRLILEQKNISPFTDELVETIHFVFVDEMVHFYKYGSSVGEKEGVSDTFRILKELNIKIAVDTGFDRTIANAVLNRMGWEQNNLIDCSVTSDEVLRGRPHPDLIYRAMQLTNVTDVKKVAKVGDTVSDLLEGNAAGCGLVIGVTSGAFSAAQLQREKHTHLIQEIPQLLEILKAEFVS